MNPLILKLKEHATQDRWNLFQKVVHERTRHVTIALEDLYQPHNASAILRTCDCFGVQDVHIIENRNTYLVNPEVALGSSHWLSLFEHNANEGDNSIGCLEYLKTAGYKTVATSPHVDGFTPEDLPLDKPVAILMGTEGKGLSEQMIEQSDYKLQIPMHGFTESFNISVSAAMILHRLTTRIRSEEIDFRLRPEEQEELLLKWLKKSIRNSDHILAEYMSRNELG
jgi:tRNA (guanosine-2'-O-)-methyltransferase